MVKEKILLFSIFIYGMCFLLASLIAWIRIFIIIFFEGYYHTIEPNIYVLIIEIILFSTALIPALGIEIYLMDRLIKEIEKGDKYNIF